MRSKTSDAQTRRPGRLSKEDPLYVYGLLKTNGMIGQVWPVYIWDRDPPVYGLTLGREMALQELNGVSDTPITERQFRTVLKKFGIAEGPIEPKLIDQFRKKRRDRRIKTSGELVP